MSRTLEIATPEAAATESLRPERTTLLGVPVDNLPMSTAVESIVARLDRPEPSQVCFVNADCVNIALRRPDYLDVLRRADLVLADGIGMRIAGRAAGVRLRDNVNGTDLFPRLCEALDGAGKKLFLLGARPGVVEGVFKWLVCRHDRLTVAGSHHGYFSADQEAAVVDQIACSGADLLLVAFGAPQQDLWIARHLDSLGVKVAIGVGGLFDFYSGRIPRAPRWMRRRGLEWTYRLWQEPDRMWRRYLLGNPRFLAAVAIDAVGRLVRPARSPNRRQPG